MVTKVAQTTAAQQVSATLAALQAAQKHTRALEVGLKAHLRKQGTAEQVHQHLMKQATLVTELAEAKAHERNCEHANRKAAHDLSLSEIARGEQEIKAATAAHQAAKMQLSTAQGALRQAEARIAAAESRVRRLQLDSAKIGLRLATGQ